MRWYLDGVLISSDYLTAPASTMPDLAPTRAGQHRLGHREAPDEREPPSATHGRYPGHRSAVERYERETGSHAAAGLAPGGAGDRVGSANYMRGQHGAPGENLTTVQTAAGPMTLNKASAPAFVGFTGELAAQGAPLGSPGSYAHRNIAGSSRASQHAYGNAVDFGNQSARNVVSPAFRSWVESHPAEWRAALNRWNMVSGGDWRNPDLGHVEWAGPRASDNTAAAPVPAEQAGSGSGKASWFSTAPYTGEHSWSDPQGAREGPQASGLPATVPGIALPSRSTLGKYFDVTAPSGETHRLRQVDIGPGPHTGRGIDINAPAAEKMGYSPQTFPTDQHFKWKRAVDTED